MGGLLTNPRVYISLKNVGAEARDDRVKKEGWKKRQKELMRKCHAFHCRQRKSQMGRTGEKKERHIVKSGGEVEEKDKGGQELSTATCKRT